MGLAFDGTGDLPLGSLSFAADTTDVAARVEVDLAGEVLAADGDAALVNERYAPVLAASAAWRRADKASPTVSLVMIVSPPWPSATTKINHE